MRLFGEIYSSDVIMHRGYSVCENFYNNIVISIHSKISTLFVVSPFLIAKVSPN